MPPRERTTVNVPLPPVQHRQLRAIVASLGIGNAEVLLRSFDFANSIAMERIVSDADGKVLDIEGILRIELLDAQGRAELFNSIDSLATRLRTLEAFVHEVSVSGSEDHSRLRSEARALGGPWTDPRKQTEAPKPKGGGAAGLLASLIALLPFRGVVGTTTATATATAALALALPASALFDEADSPAWEPPSTPSAPSTVSVPRSTVTVAASSAASASAPSNPRTASKTRTVSAGTSVPTAPPRKRPSAPSTPTSTAGKTTSGEPSTRDSAVESSPAVACAPCSSSSTGEPRPSPPTAPSVSKKHPVHHPEHPVHPEPPSMPEKPQQAVEPTLPAQAVGPPEEKPIPKKPEP